MSKKLITIICPFYNELSALPLFFGKLSAKFFQLFPNTLLTVDQLKLLKYDNQPLFLLVH